MHLLDATMFWSRTGGGVGRYLREKQNWIAGHTAWTHTIVTPFVDAYSGVAVPSWPLPGSGGYRLPWNRTAAAQQIEAQAPDLIEADDPYRLAWSVLDAGQRLGVPTVAFCHSNLERLAASHAGGVAGRLARAYAARLYRRFDRVYAPSRAMVDHLLDWGVERVFHQPLGVDTRMFRPCAGDGRWRVRLGLPANARLLVYAGRYAAEKHLDVLSAAVARLGPRYWLVAAGGGPRPPRGERVVRIGYLRSAREMARLLAEVDAFVHAGDQETFGLGVLESLACGTPVVARQAEGLAELVDGSVGAAVPAGTCAAFAEAIHAVCVRPSPERAEAARRRALAYDWGRVLPALCRSYEHLLGHPAPRTPAWAGLQHAG
ncbi:MAG: glycosyltransferase [Proteobacteria bacterium]|nr:glycosyltransferase [Pseudomonadota bacterium]